MKASSAMALVSAMPGAGTPWATSFFSACAIVSSFLSQPTSTAAAMTRIISPSMKVRFVVLMPFLPVSCGGSVAHRPDDPYWALGQYVALGCLPMA